LLKGLFNKHLFGIIQTTLSKFQMMKKLLLVFVMLISLNGLFAQFNVTYISDVPYPMDLNDIWGYVDPNGVEYALVGTVTGTSIVSLADPANPVEVAFVAGDQSIWRDIKTWGTTAYVTTDQGNDGLTVIDLSNLPNSVSSFQMTDLGTLGILQTCHNIWIDEFGYAYLAGCNLNSGGMIYIDCFTTPGQPIYAGVGAPVYSHDVYTRDNKMYGSEIYDGGFSIYDVSDKSNTLFLGFQETDFAFTHNSWLNDASNVLFTTDEQPNAPIGSYDVSDPSDIKTLDLFKPLNTLGEGVIPHNVHVWQDWVIISYYTDGCIIVDGSNPSNLIEVGNFDTYIPGNTGFNGAWGAYPFLPSGLVLVSDINYGLFVLEPNYVRACWLEGKVTDITNNSPINGATVAITATELNQGSTDAIGDYKTGLATAGTYNVTYAAAGYLPETVSVTLDNGVITIQDVQLTPLPGFAISGTVLDELSGNPIPGASVVVYNNDFTFNLTTAANGTFSINSVIQGNYTVIAGKWGHKAKLETANVSAPLNFTIELARGYRDEFALNLGWTVDGNAETGDWERAEPFGTSGQGGQQFNPEFDVTSDLGDQCYVTGNDGAGGVGNDDVDNGNTVLTSPVMDLSNYTNVSISFYAWFANGGGAGNPNDQLTATLDNGQEQITLLTITSVGTNGWAGPYEFAIEDSLLTNNMTVFFETADQGNSGHLVEAAVDLFEVTGEVQAVAVSNITNTYQLAAMPNPFKKEVSITYDLPEKVISAQLVVYNTLGQVVSRRNIAGSKGVIIIDDLIMKGLYLAQIEADGLVSEPVKLMKVE
jgi:choice-of-anchor B domain-containing protein